MNELIFNEELHIAIPEELITKNFGFKSGGRERIIPFEYYDNVVLHVSMLQVTIYLLNKIGFDIKYCMCGKENNERGCGNMYFLINGFPRFNSLPDGFTFRYFLGIYDIRYTILCPNDFNPDMMPPEMQDYFIEKTAILHNWAFQKLQKSPTNIKFLRKEKK